MSGSHAKVEVLGDSVYVTDLKSTNGTFVQDEKIKPETKTEVSLVLRPLAPPNAAGPPKADAVPSHSPPSLGRSRSGRASPSGTPTSQATWSSRRTTSEVGKAFLLERARPRPSFLSSGSAKRNHFFLHL